MLTSKSIGKFTAFVSAAVFAPLNAMAQDAPAVNAVTVTHVVEPHLVTAAVVGLFLAFAFQLIFTLISLTAGFSLTPNLMKLSAKHKADRLAAGHPLHMDDEDKAVHAHHAAASIGIVNELGIWVMGTTSIALFLATWLSMRLSFLGTDEYRYVLALTVWAAYLIFVTYLEWKSVKTVAGGLFGIAVAGLHASKEVLGGLLHKSPEQRLEDFGERTMKHIYQDLAHATHKGKIDKKLARYFSDLKPQGVDYDQIHDEIASFLKQAKKETGYDANNIENVIDKLSKRLEKPHSIFTTTNAALLYAAIRRAAQTAKASGMTPDNFSGYAETLIHLPESEIRALREKVEAFLAKTNREELNPETIRQDIEAIIANPGDSVGIVRNRLSHFNRDTLRSLLSQVGVNDNGRIDQIIGAVTEGAVAVGQKYHEGVDYTAQMQAKAGDMLNSARDTVKSASDSVRALPQKFEDKIHGYIDSLGAPELNYETLKLDLEDLLHDPMEAPHIVRDRLATFDAGTLDAVLRANPWIPVDRIKSIVAQVDQTKKELVKNVASLEDKAVAIFEENRRRAAIAAEHARKAAAAAGWWAVGTAIVSGGASLAGAYYSAFSF